MLVTKMDESGRVEEKKLLDVRYVPLTSKSEQIQTSLFQTKLRGGKKSEVVWSTHAKDEIGLEM